MFNQAGAADPGKFMCASQQRYDPSRKAKGETSNKKEQEDCGQRSNVGRILWRPTIKRKASRDQTSWYLMMQVAARAVQGQLPGMAQECTTHSPLGQNPSASTGEQGRPERKPVSWTIVVRKDTSVRQQVHRHKRAEAVQTTLMIDRAYEEQTQLSIKPCPRFKFAHGSNVKETEEEDEVCIEGQ
nr:hypothetical protein CFP56_00390 [Quercus suber]